MVKLPKLQPSNRNREFLERSKFERARIVESWLMSGQLSHRAMDDLLLGLNPLETRGWKSMGVLAYLGLKKEFKGLFFGQSLEVAIKALQEDDQNFDLVVDCLEQLKESYELGLNRLSVPEYPKSFRSKSSLLASLSRLDSTNGKLGGEAFYRKEQALLRQQLLKSKKDARCSFCHKKLPVDLIVAAHIKPRYICSHEERTNSAIVMPLCKLGCDDFYEKGYLLVDEAGLIYVRENNQLTKDLRDVLLDFNGKQCLSFTDETKGYFADRVRLLAY